MLRLVPRTSKAHREHPYHRARKHYARDDCGLPRGDVKSGVARHIFGAHRCEHDRYHIEIVLDREVPHAADERRAAGEISTET